MEWWELPSCLLKKNQGKWKIIWKSKKICELKKYLKNGVELKLFEKKNWSFEIYLKIEVSKIKFKNWNFAKNIWKHEFWKLKLGKLNLKNGVLKIIQNLKFWKLNLKIWELNLKFRVLEK